MFYCTLLCYILCDMELAFLSLFFQIDFVIFTYDFFQLFLSLVLKQFDHNLLWYSFPCICFSSCLLNFLLCVLMVSVRSEYNFNSYHFFKYHSFHSICQTLVVMYGTGILISFSVFCLWCLSTGSSCNSFFFQKNIFLWYLIWSTLFISTIFFFKIQLQKAYLVLCFPKLSVHLFEIDRELHEKRGRPRSGSLFWCSDRSAVRRQPGARSAGLTRASQGHGYCSHHSCCPSLSALARSWSWEPEVVQES